MTSLEFVGAVTVGLVGVAIGVLLGEAIGNVYGGIKGAYRLRAIKMRYLAKPIRHWPTIRLGLRNWHGGNRYKNGYGTYWIEGGIIVPVDGRDKLSRERFYGA